VATPAGPKPSKMLHFEKHTTAEAKLASDIVIQASTEVDNQQIIDEWTGSTTDDTAALHQVYHNLKRSLKMIRQEAPKTQNQTGILLETDGQRIEIWSTKVSGNGKKDLLARIITDHSKSKQQ